MVTTDPLLQQVFIVDCLIKGVHARATKHLNLKNGEAIACHDPDAAAMSNFCFGEVAPLGVEAAFKNLKVENAKIVWDLGHGNGKLLIQAFLQFQHLQEVHGVELSGTRAVTSLLMLGELATKFQDLKLAHSSNSSASFVSSDYKSFPFSVPLSSSLQSVELLKDAFKVGICAGPTFSEDGQSKGEGKSEDKGNTKGRILTLARQDLFQVLEEAVTTADILLIEVKLVPELRKRVCEALCRMKRGSRLLTFENFRLNFAAASIPCPFKDIADDKGYKVSWTQQYWTFFLYEKL